MEYIRLDYIIPRLQLAKYWNKHKATLQNIVWFHSAYDTSLLK